MLSTLLAAAVLAIAPPAARTTQLEVTGTGWSYAGIGSDGMALRADGTWDDDGFLLFVDLVTLAWDTSSGLTPGTTLAECYYVATQLCPGGSPTSGICTFKYVQNPFSCDVTCKPCPKPTAEPNPATTP